MWRVLGLIFGRQTISNAPELFSKILQCTFGVGCLTNLDTGAITKVLYQLHEIQYISHTLGYCNNQRFYAFNDILNKRNNVNCNLRMCALW